MAVGGHAVNLLDKWLNMLAGTAFTAPTGTFVKLHIGDPGAAGTSNPSTETTRKAMTWSVSSGGSKAISAQAQWAAWSASAETISHASVWDNLTAGSFLYSFAFAASKPVTAGDTLNMISHTISITPLAA